MKDLIINSLELFCKIGVFLLVVSGTLVGLLTGNPFVAIACLIASFVAAVVIFGLLFLLIDINDNLRSLRYTVEKNSEPPKP
ncbi:MAG: hypothetical protein P4M15_11455 [Alphaproteobacteria bacterium]|nr:hypothetical protein [Alphaproteobacteria bacterium]